MNMNSAINTQKPRKIPIYRKAKWDSMKEDVSNLHRKLQQEGTNGACPKSFWKRVYFFIVLWCRNVFYIFPICLSRFSLYGLLEMFKFLGVLWMV
jgi:hypothetical protein